MDEVLRLERVIDLPRVIVWDALVDPVLAEGWLHPTARLVPTDPADGGDAHDAHDVVVLERRERESLRVDSPEFGRLAVTLDEIPGGTRGTATALRLTVTASIDARSRPPVVASWQTRLDQLENLLRGHPVDWDNWQRDHGADYEVYLQQAAAR